MILVICLALAAGAIGFTLFLREQDIPPAPVENPELKHLEARRQVLYENLKDLQFEYHQGKLTDEDYQSLKQGFLYDLAGVMDSIERMELRGGKHSKAAHKAEPIAERASKSQQKQTATTSERNVCPSCKKSNPEGNRFCGHCGQPLTQ
ncbi:MAG: hypothetical protein A3H94_05965 [Acidobacteria bacterium RIFCSPLOWO2_02_FULL_60_20]|nr:MAG: hypothetical protein A3H94_05965 [Acidobacteria bacterium RIFCSPLOWO2_02_FULL_60_20]